MAGESPLPPPPSPSLPPSPPLASPALVLTVDLALLCCLLCSRDGYEFYVSRSCAVCSGTIRRLLQSPSAWAETSSRDSVPTIRFESISGRILEQCCQYFYYKQRWDRHTPPFPPFKMDLQPEELLLAANFLDT